MRVAPTSNPPRQLLARSVGSLDAEHFWAVGARLADTFTEAITTHAQRPVTDLLDWGCGTGRIAWYLNQQPQLQLAGCDLDAEAVQWCNTNIRAGAFTHNDIRPPLPYPDETFDAVIGCSVMTHLQRRWQLAWLTEISRILRPGGVLAASVHGLHAAAAYPGFPEHVVNVGGIDDSTPTLSHRDITPKDWYRDTYQTAEYTLRRWAERIPVVDYAEAAVNGHQDLVICRKPTQSAPEAHRTHPTPAEAYEHQ